MVAGEDAGEIFTLGHRLLGRFVFVVFFRRTSSRDCLSKQDFALQS